MRVDGNGERPPNYYPNSSSEVKPDIAYAEPGSELDSRNADWFDRNGEGEDDHYSQPGIFYREVLSDEGKAHIVENIVGAMMGIDSPTKEEIINRQLCHFFRADKDLGAAVAKGLGVDVEEPYFEGIWKPATLS